MAPQNASGVARTSAKHPREPRRLKGQADAPDIRAFASKLGMQVQRVQVVVGIVKIEHPETQFAVPAWKSPAQKDIRLIKLGGGIIGIPLMIPVALGPTEES